MPEGSGSDDSVDGPQGDDLKSPLSGDGAGHYGEIDLQVGDSIIIAGQVVTVLEIVDGEVVIEVGDSFALDEPEGSPPRTPR